MKKTTLSSMILIAIILILFTWVWVLKNKVNAKDELIELQQQKFALQEENKQLEAKKKEESDGWWVDQYGMEECVKSFKESQTRRNKNNIKREQQIQANSWKIEELDRKMGLILSSQAL